ncbi:hypothetical protein F2Q69_00024717 [Brassica cretica]|uniref:Uncharacterized protein n=1 Tax=Brassica cretica TaxID=69181 RepID=A0A8S9QBK2_BRACR|nr:hypothetical protein F2Q69_00024717 [Brassica cretica]
MVRQRRKSEKEEEKREQEDGEQEDQKVQPRQRSVSRRNMQSLVIGLVGGALTLGIEWWPDILRPPNLQHL